MSLRKATITWTNKQIVKMINKESISFENLIQRGYVWEKVRKSKLIESIILGYPIPPVYAKKGENKVYDVLDGKQRLTAIKGFIEDEYALTGLAKTISFENELGEREEAEFNDLKFSELDEILQEMILISSVSVHYFDDITLEEEREMFKRLNNGKPLSVKERNIANSVDIENILTFANHSMIEQMFTKKAIENKKFVPLVMKTHMMITNNIKDISFISKDFNAYLENTIITDEMKKIMELFNYIEWVNSCVQKLSKKKKPKMEKETHFISLIPFIAHAIFIQNDGKGIHPERVANWVVAFFESEIEVTSISEEYNAACLAGSAKAENIRKRHNALQKSYKEYFKEDFDKAEVKEEAETKAKAGVKTETEAVTKARAKKGD